MDTPRSTTEHTITRMRMLPVTTICWVIIHRLSTIHDADHILMSRDSEEVKIGPARHQFHEGATVYTENSSGWHAANTIIRCLETKLVNAYNRDNPVASVRGPRGP